MPRKKTTRTPAPLDGPQSLTATRDDDKAATLAAAKRTLAWLVSNEREVTKANWEEGRMEVDPPGCSWRATYRPHVAHLFADMRAEKDDRVSRSDHDALRRRYEQALKCIGERDVKVEVLRARIRELEEENAKLSRGTLSRRRRKRKEPDQGRQSGDAASGSD